MNNQFTETRRVSIEDTNVELVTSLTKEFFNTYADVLAFAAAYGASSNDFCPVEKSGKIDPIRYDIFVSKNYERLFDLLAIYRTNDVAALDLNEEKNEERIKTFEGYANAGLKILKAHLKDHAIKIDGIELLLKKFQSESQQETPVDITDLLV